MVVIVVSAYAILALVSVGSVVFLQQSAGARDMTEVAETISTIVGALLVVRGIVELPRSRYRAYHWFARGVLVWMLVTQVFIFYSSQLAGIGGLAADLLAYAVLRYLIRREVAAGRGPTLRPRSDGRSWRGGLSRLVRPRRHQAETSSGTPTSTQPEAVGDQH